MMQWTAAELTIIGGFAMALVLVFGWPTIAILRRKGAGQRVRNDGPQRHLDKEGTPTMGGILIVGATIIAALSGELVKSGGASLEMISLLAVTLAFACIGAVDDWLKIGRGRSLGLRARQKLMLQALVAGVFVYALANYRAVLLAGGETPGVRPITAGWAAFWVIAVVGVSNAVNLSDGLDGLAAGLCAVGGIGFALLAFKADNGQATLVAIGLAGSCLGFLFFNRHPAQVFMGDVGSLALGGALASLAAWLDQPLALAGLCLVPLGEAGSVIIQVISFKTTGKRVFRMSPIHHHFELLGWSERRVVVTFWLVALVAAGGMIGVVFLR